MSWVFWDVTLCFCVSRRLEGTVLLHRKQSSSLRGQCKDTADLATHGHITLVDFQLDAQNSCLFTYNTFIKILYTFRALPCLSSGGLHRNCIYAASGIVTLCRRLSRAPVKKELLRVRRV